MIKKFGFYAILFCAIAVLLNGCASDSTSQSTSSPSTVPGERRDGSDVTPGMGPGGASANVRW